MPVQFDDYVDHADALPWTVREGSNAYHLLSYLVQHPNTGFTASELAAATEVPEGSIGPTLQRLKKRGLVRHKEPYWAIVADDRLAAIDGMLRSMATIADDPADEGWADVDPSAYEVDPDALAAWRERDKK